MNVMFLVVSTILFLRIVHGYQKGCVRMALGFATLFLSVAVMGILGPVVSDRLCESEVVVNELSETVNRGLGIEEHIYGSLQQNTTHSYKKNQKIGSREQEKVISGLGLPKMITDTLLDGLQEVVSNQGRIVVRTISEYICEGIARMIIRSVTYFGIFFISKLILQILLLAFRVVERIPGIEDLNQLLGAGLGAVSGIIVVWFLFVLLLSISSTQFGTQCYQNINDSAFLTFLYNHNLLLKWILSGVN